MELKEMSIEEMETRKAAIAEELEAPEADLDALKEEVRAINEELEARKAAEAARDELRKAVAAGEGEVIVEKIEKEERKIMTNEEIRNSAEYIDAYAKYIRSGSDKECRSLLTENASGSLPVPALVDEIIRTAWDKNELLARVKKTYFKGNLKVAFELSADGAWEHNEGTSAPTEQALSLGIVTMTPKNIKKWVRISDESVAMGGEAFLRYIYDELTYHIVKKLADLIVADIVGSPTSSDSDEAGVKKVTVAPSVSTIAEAFANLSDEATDPVIVMNKLTYADFVKAQAAANYAFDPFMGLPVIYNNSLPAYATADSNAVYAIVGDLKGAQVNYPEGEGVVIKWDDLTEAEADLVKVVGRQYAAHDVTAPYYFTNIAKPSGSATT